MSLEKCPTMSVFTSKWVSFLAIDIDYFGQNAII